MGKNENEIFLGGGTNLSFKQAKLITTGNLLKLQTKEDGIITLDVKIQADFDTIPEKYHEVFFNILSAKYLDSVSFGDNPFSKCLPPKKKKWWQFWKANLNI